jgi:hypothetical protein
VTYGDCLKGGEVYANRIAEQRPGYEVKGWLCVVGKREALS